MRAPELDAVTIDAFGTLVGLRDPVPRLAALTGRAEDEVGQAFAAEAAYYVARSHEGRDETTLARLQGECTEVFNHALGSSITPDALIGALELEELPGVRPALAALAARGLALAVVTNWDCLLPDHLERLGLARHFSAIVTSAEAGVPKPDPRPFRLALAALGSDPGRTLHVGDDESDVRGAAAAGLRFAPAPLPAAVAALS